MDMQRGHAAWGCSVDIQHGHEAWHTVSKCGMGMQHGHAVWTCCVHLQRENAAWRHVHEAETVSMEMPQLHQNAHEE